ncbi:MAG: hypothetical protein ACI81W_002297, partial [Saprospiraceae bacterium]
MKIAFPKLLLLSAILFAGFHSFAQSDVTNGAQSRLVKLLGHTGELRHKMSESLANQEKNIHSRDTQFLNTAQHSQPYLPLSNNNPAASPDEMDPVRQVFSLLSVIIPVVPILNFDGIDVTETFNSPVPNPNGDVSPDHYIQITNAAIGSIFKIFGKDGTLLFGPASLNTFWDSFNITGHGNPIVLWDQGAERWLFTELGEFGSKMMLVAVSMTSDPLGNWYAYQFQATGLPDCPKYGIWPDAYYVTTAEGEGA